MRKIRKVQDVIARVSLSAAAVLLAAVAASLFINVLDRFIFHMGLMWVEMFARYGLIWSVFLAANVLIYKNALMRVDFMDNIWPTGFKKVRERIYIGIFIIMLSILMWFGMEQATDYIGVSVLGLPVDKFWVYLSVPVGAGLMMVQYLLNLVITFMEWTQGGTKEL